MANTTKPDVSKKDLERAHDTWVAFMDAAKWSTVGIALILILMAIVFI